MRFQDITFTVDIDALSEEEYNKLMAKIAESMPVIGEVNTMTYDDKLMESLGYSSPEDFIEEEV